MKKLISIILVLTLTLIMSGCSSDKKFPVDGTDLQKDTYCSRIYNFRTDNCQVYLENKQPAYYTQEEIDLMIQELEARIEELEARIEE